MTKGKKTKPPQRLTALDRLAGQLRTALRHGTKNVIEIGKILIEIRDKHLEHGEWRAWLAENFDLSYRTALRYADAAEYVDRKGKSDTVADFANLSPSVLYWLAADQRFDEKEESAILAATRERRVDEDAAWAICEALAPPDDDDDHDADDGDDTGDAGGDDPAKEDAEIEGILDGPPPAVPPPAPNQAPPDFALGTFDFAIGSLKRLMTKQAAEFAATSHSVNDLESVGDFIRAVKSHLRQEQP